MVAVPDSWLGVFLGPSPWSNKIVRNSVVGRHIVGQVMVPIMYEQKGWSGFMRVGVVTATFPPTYWGGTGNVAYQNACALVQGGHDVTVLTGAVPPREEVKYPFSVQYLPTWLRIGNAPLAPGLATRLSKFDVVHLHYPFIGGADIVWAVCGLTGIPVVVTYHNRLQSPEGARGLLFALYNSLMEPRILRAAAVRIAVSRDHALKTAAVEGPWEEVPNGVDTELFAPTDKEEAKTHCGGDQKSPVVLFVGALDRAHWFKNLGGLIAAMPQVESKVNLWVVGDGDLRGQFEKQVASLGLSERVSFWGARRPTELPTFYNAADVTVLPSLSTESFGVVLIESLSCSTPVIATDLPGVRRVVDPGEDGFLVEAGSSMELAEAIGKFVDMGEDARRTMGRRGRSKILRKYSLTEVGHELVRLIESVG